MDEAGSNMYVAVTLLGKRWKGRLIELELMTAGPRMLRSQMEQAMERSVTLGK